MPQCRMHYASCSTLLRAWLYACWDLKPTLTDTCVRLCQSYIPECNWMSNACACTWMWMRAWMLCCLYTSVGCECTCALLQWDSTEKNRWRVRRKERKKERKGVERRSKVKLHDEHIGPVWAQINYVHTVRVRLAHLSMDGRLGCWISENTWIHTQRAHTACKQPQQCTTK